ncbi:cation transporter [Pseudarthrobacter sp. NamB4]|uniref:cation transporter n=1 Tax=Pseudarthrobacter sp. NamB4 TaxID=2576837 RepID=UPI0010FEC7E4|nr:cation transporter [Pseudarthrobacter sp. NamB4]TLM75118.1 cation transporter [Pseudarthrobacter sp. NamB4]
MTNVKNSSDAVRFGNTDLPAEQQEALRKAMRIEWATMGFLAVTTTMVFLVLGNSQAMKAAWVEDILSFLPPISFLVAAHAIRKPPSEKHPYGYHRSTGVAHLVAAVALTVMGGYLLVESVLGLLKAEHPTIGGIEIFGNTIWLGWLMMAVMIITSAPPVFLGRAKMKLAEKLHDKVLYADADMNKADWMTAIAAVAGVAGIGFGLWWADYGAALIISASILRDGIGNTRGAVSALMDKRAMTYDDKEPHPLGRQLDEYLRSLDWTRDAKSRIRDEGHVFHVESFVVPAGDSMPTFGQLEAARDACAAMDWKVQDIVIIPVAELPSELLPGPGSGGER